MYPNITTTTKAPGIFQGDLIIQTAIQEAITDIRANPWLLDYCFAGLVQDPLTSSRYGKAALDVAKRWFLRHDIKVQMGISLNKIEFPCIAIEMASSLEDDTTLADVNYDVEEDIDQQWPILAGPFTPVSLNAVTGLVALPPDSLDGVILAAGMSIVTNSGKAYIIQELGDNAGEVYLSEGTTDNFTDCTVRGSKPPQRISLEGSWAREVYSVVLYTQSDPITIIYLDSVFRFIFMRYRQRLFEARGFESSTITATNIQTDQSFQVELTYMRAYALSGRIRNYWPKDIMDRFTSVTVQEKIIGGETVPKSDIPEGNTVNDLFWVGDEDSLG